MWSSSSIPTEAAWAVLKRDDMDSLPPELESQMQSFYDQIPDEQREKIEQLGQAVETMDPETKHKIKTMLLQTVMHNADRMPEILEDADPSGLFGLKQTEPGTFKIDSGPVKKAFFVPIVIAAVFAADGVNQSQGAKASIVGNGLMHTGAALGLNDPPKTSAFDYESGVATFQDPFIGVELGRVENPSWWQRAGAGTLGALQGLSPFKGAKGTARASTKATEKVSRLKQARPMGPAKTKRAQSKLDAKDLKIVQAGDKATAARVKAAKSRTLMGRAATGAKKGGHRLAQATFGDPRFKEAVGPLLAGSLSSNAPSPNISGTASATPSAGGGGTGVGGMTNVGNTRQGDKQIWQKQGGQGALERQREGQGGGGYGTNKGDNMKIGEQILKTVTTRMNNDYLTKGKCPECGKEHIAKMGCTAKADKKCPHCDGDAPRSKCICGDTKKASKKPAHGMIIVLGAQGSGPGPSKDGKRTKK